MPAIVRKILICAAIDGLIIQPLSSKGQRPHQPVQIKYGDATVSSVAREQVPDSKLESSFEAFGVIGMAPRFTALRGGTDTDFFFFSNLLQD